MDHFDKNDFDYLDDINSSEVPSEFAWEEMKVGIYGKQKRKRRFLPYFWLTAGALLLFFTVAILFFVNKNGDIEMNETPKELEVQGNLKNQDKLVVEKELVQQGTVEEGNINQTNKGILKPKAGKKKNTIQAATIPEQKDLAITLKQNVETQKDNILRLNKSKESVDYSTRITEEANGKTHSILSQVLESNFDVKQIAPINSIPTKVISYDNEISFHVPIPPSVDAVNNDKVFAKSWTISSFVAANMWSSQYQEDQNVGIDRNNATSQLIGFSASFGAEKMIRKNIYVGADLGYHTWSSQFESDATRDVDVEVENVLLSYRKNRLTGSNDQETYGSLILPGKQKRYVKHYNEFSAIRVGSFVGVKIDLSDKWRADFKIGPGVLIGTRQEGKTYQFDKDIVEYNQDNKIYKDFAVGIQPSLRLSYMVKENIGIGLQINHDRYFSNWSDENLVVRPSRTDVGCSIFLQM